MRILGIDYGDSRIGIALSDIMGWTANGLETIKWNCDIGKAVERIRIIINDYDIKKIVVGFPKNMDGSIGPRAVKTQEFINLLTEATGLGIVKWDERLTTVAAERTMHELGIKTSKKKNVVDQIAAVYILQAYLDKMSSRE